MSNLIFFNGDFEFLFDVSMLATSTNVMKRELYFLLSFFSGDKGEVGDQGVKGVAGVNGTPGTNGTPGIH